MDIILGFWKKKGGGGVQVVGNPLKVHNYHASLLSPTLQLLHDPCATLQGPLCGHPATLWQHLAAFFTSLLFSFLFFFFRFLW